MKLSLNSSLRYDKNTLEIETESGDVMTLFEIKVLRVYNMFSEVGQYEMGSEFRIAGYGEYKEMN